MTIPFHPLARLLARTLHPAATVEAGAMPELFQSMMVNGNKQGVLITANHYSAPDFQAWWIGILVSAVVPREVHWVVTSGWTNSGWLTGFTHWLFPRGASLLGFTPMPAMPPNPAEVEQRANAVRDVLGYARHSQWPVIGLVPEGGDQPGGVLGELPPGSGRFMHLLNRSCPLVLPVGVWKEGGQIRLVFGDPYLLDAPAGLSSSELDRKVGDQVMHRIASCLPTRLRGRYI